MELKDWMQPITSRAAIAVTIWVEVRRDKPDKEGPVQAETQKEVKRVPARPISRNPSANPIFHGTS